MPQDVAIGGIHHEGFGAEILGGRESMIEAETLVGVEMRPQRAGHVGEARLAQHRIVEQALDQDDF